MASLYEYFKKDGAENLTTQKTWEVCDTRDGRVLGKVIARLHQDFDALAKYVSFYIPAMDRVTLPEALALNQIREVLEWPNAVGVISGIGEERTDARDLIFTGRVYIYSERPVSSELKQRIVEEANQFGWRIIFRSVEYLEERQKFEKPRAFISHDSRDKDEIAAALALELQKLMCPVWYDEYSLKVGDSLRESIESGLKECAKCILILTPNFLANSGWTKREYDSIFTRELVEKRKVILPVWHKVTAEEVYQYSPILADRVAVQWTLGVEDVARKLSRSINS